MLPLFLWIFLNPIFLTIFNTLRWPPSVLQFVKDQFAPIPPVANLDLTGRVVIVTGSNVGLGLEAAKHYVGLKASKVVLAVRSVSKGEEAKKQIVEAHPGVEGGVVEVWELDLSSFKSTISFVERVNRELERVDIVNANAGVAFRHWTTTKDGYETTLQTNVINTGLLGLLLLPKLEQTALAPVPSASSTLKPHLTLTGSTAHYKAKFIEHPHPHPIHALNDAKKFQGPDRYDTSKLLDIYLAREIGRLATDKVVVNVVDPGLCHSEIMRNLGVGEYLMYFLTVLIGRTTEVGSRTLVWAATNGTPQGGYSASCRVEEESDFVLSKKGYEAQARVWADLTEIWIAQAPHLVNVLK